MSEMTSGEVARVGAAPAAEPTAAQLAQVTAAYEDRAKNKTIMYVLWWFTGVVGGHRFYLGDIGYAFGMLFTLGGLGVWALVDVFIIGKRLQTKNAEIRRQVYTMHGIPVHA